MTNLANKQSRTILCLGQNLPGIINLAFFFQIALQTLVLVCLEEQVKGNKPAL